MTCRDSKCRAAAVILGRGSSKCRAVAVILGRRSSKCRAVAGILARTRDRGAAAIEAALLVPALGLILAFAITTMRIDVTRQVIDGAARDAARAASQAHAAADATAAARDAATAALTGQGIQCRSGPGVRIDTSQFNRPAGQPAAVTVTVTCVVDLSDIAIPGEPGAVRLSAVSTSDIDRYTERS